MIRVLTSRLRLRRLHALSVAVSVAALLVAGPALAANTATFRWRMDGDAQPQTIAPVNRANVQAVLNWSIEPAQAIVIKNARQIGLKVPIFQSHGFANIK